MDKVIPFPVSVARRRTASTRSEVCQIVSISQAQRKRESDLERRKRHHPAFQGRR